MTTTLDMSRYTVTILPMAEIYCDAAFNCRGPIAMSECLDLASDVKARGLDFPIHVQEYSKLPGFKYRIVSGHRRFTAFKVNKETEIPSVIRYDLSDELEAREANLRENIQRSDLNMLQEAEAISYFITAGNNNNQIASRLGKSCGWVDVRKKLLDLPDMVRTAAREGVVTQAHIHQLHQHRSNPTKIAEMLRLIRERVQAGERGIVIREDVKIIDFAKVRKPKAGEGDEFLEVIGRNITNRLPDGEECFAHKVASYYMGYSSQAAIYAALKRETEKLGFVFRAPADIEKIMTNLTRA